MRLKKVKYNPNVSMKRSIGTVYDITEPLTLSIQTQDVAGATVADECACVITQCALRTVSQAVKMWTYNTIAYIELSDGIIVRGELSRSAQEMRKVFDTSSCFPLGDLKILPPKKIIGSRKGQSGSNVRKGNAPNLLKKAPTRAIAGKMLETIAQTS